MRHDRIAIISGANPISVSGGRLRRAFCHAARRLRSRAPANIAKRTGNRHDAIGGSDDGTLSTPGRRWGM